MVSEIRARADLSRRINRKVPNLKGYRPLEKSVTRVRNAPLRTSLLLLFLNLKTWKLTCFRFDLFFKNEKSSS